tara:strand:+ start:126 stop:1601 length:1476 start_codon:yes stop_codon:yes gene_type:complete
MPLPDAPDYSKRIYELLKETDLENLSYAQFQGVAEKLFIEPENEDEMRRLVLVQLARMAVRGDWDGFLTGGGGSGGAPTSAEYVVMALNGTLTNERKLTAGTRITITDGGAGGDVTIAADASPVTSLIAGTNITLSPVDGLGDVTISASGGGAVSFPLEGTAGSVSAPTYSFTGDTNTGMYLPGADTLGFTVGGNERLNVANNKVSGIAFQTTGTNNAASPDYQFTTDPDTGIFKAGTNEIGFTAGGSEKFRMSASGQLGIGGANYGTSGQVLTSAGASSAAEWTTPTGGASAFSPELVGVELDQAGTGYAVFDILSLPPYGTAFFATGGIDTKQYFFPWIAPKSGNISDVLINFTSGAGSATDVYYSFYRDNSGVPSTMLGYVTANGQTTGLQTLTSFSSTVTVVRGTQYWLGQNKSTSQSITMQAFNNAYRPRIAPYEAFPSTTNGYGTSLTTNSDVSGTPADITAEGLEPGIFFAGLGAAPHIGIKIV